MERNKLYNKIDIRNNPKINNIVREAYRQTKSIITISRIDSMYDIIYKGIKEYLEEDIKDIKIKWNTKITGYDIGNTITNNMIAPHDPLSTITMVLTVYPKEGKKERRDYLLSWYQSNDINIIYPYRFYEVDYRKSIIDITEVNIPKEAIIVSPKLRIQNLFCIVTRLFMILLYIIFIITLSLYTKQIGSSTSAILFFVSTIVFILSLAFFIEDGPLDE